MSKKRKRYAVVAGLIVAVLIGGGIVAVVTPASKMGAYPAADQTAFLAGCEEAEGKAPNPAQCHCVLAKTEANYSYAAYRVIAEGLKRGVPAPHRFKQEATECSAPSRGKWDAEAQSTFVANCSQGKQELTSQCRCLVGKIAATYSGVEAETMEADNDARFIAVIKKWGRDCEPHESSKGK